MKTPIDPKRCKRTGRLLTEWFEYPDVDDELLWEMAYEEFGVTPDDVDMNRPMLEWGELERKMMTFVSSRKRRRWGVKGMTLQEVQFRLNEASKFVSPDNYKFLDEETSERTGLEINPLWQMEVLVRSGVLSPKEQVAALKELAAYTHSKAPNINKNMNVNGSPEEWLEALAQEEYKTLDEAGVMPDPVVRAERGYGKGADNSQHTQRVQETARLVNYNEKRLEDFMAEVDQIEDADFEEIMRGDD